MCAFFIAVVPAAGDISMTLSVGRSVAVVHSPIVTRRLGTRVSTRDEWWRGRERGAREARASRWIRRRRSMGLKNGVHRVLCVDVIAKWDEGVGADDAAAGGGGDADAGGH